DKVPPKACPERSCPGRGAESPKARLRRPARVVAHETPSEVLPRHVERRQCPRVGRDQGLRSQIPAGSPRPQAPVGSPPTAGGTRRAEPIAASAHGGRRIVISSGPRILLIGDSLAVGGTEGQLTEIACRLSRSAWQLDVSCLRAEGPLRARLEAAGVSAWSC